MFVESSLAISKLLGLTPLFISDRVMFEQKPQTKLSFFRISIVSFLYEPSGCDMHSIGSPIRLVICW